MVIQTPLSAQNPGEYSGAYDSDIARLYSAQQSMRVNSDNTSLDWAVFFEDGSMYLRETIKRVAREISRWGSQVTSAYDWGKNTFTYRDIQGWLMHYDINVDDAEIKSALRAFVSVRILERNSDTGEYCASASTLRNQTGPFHRKS